LLHDCRTLRLVVLNSCEGARNTRLDPFAGIAAGLLRQGIPAVVAMQFEITDETAITFSTEFYTAIVGAAMYNIAVIYAHGEVGVPKDDAEAVKWYRRAAQAGYYPATTELKRRGLSIESDVRRRW
jgi:hypothetical protein